MISLSMAATENSKRTFKRHAGFQQQRSQGGWMDGTNP